LLVFTASVPPPTATRSLHDALPICKRLVLQALVVRSDVSIPVSDGPPLRVFLRSVVIQRFTAFAEAVAHHSTPVTTGPALRSIHQLAYIAPMHTAPATVRKQHTRISSAVVMSVIVTSPLRVD